MKKLNLLHHRASNANRISLIEKVADSIRKNPQSPARNSNKSVSQSRINISCVDQDGNMSDGNWSTKNNSRARRQSAGIAHPIYGNKHVMINDLIGKLRSP